MMITVIAEYTIWHVLIVVAGLLFGIYALANDIHGSHHSKKK